MIVTLTANPSLDRTVGLTGPLERGRVHRTERSTVDPGGKGINVARVLHAATTEVVAVLPANAGDPLLAALDEQGIAHRAVPTSGPTRNNITVAEPDGTTTKLNEPGTPCTGRTLGELHELGALVGRQVLEPIHRSGEDAGLGRRDDALARPGAQLPPLRHERVEVRLRDVRARAQKQGRERDRRIVERGGAPPVHCGGRLIDRVFHSGVMLHRADRLVRGGQQRPEVFDLGVELADARGVFQRLFRIARHGDLAAGAHLGALVDIDRNMRARRREHMLAPHDIALRLAKRSFQHEVIFEVIFRAD